MSDIEAMAKAVENLVTARDHVSFAELGREVPGFAAGADDPAITLSVGNQTVWIMSVGADAALWRLLDQRRVCLSPASALVYLVDGEMMTAANWQPMVLRPGAEANFISVSGMPMHVPKQGVALFRRRIARDKKAGRSHWTEIKRAAS